MVRALRHTIILASLLLATPAWAIDWTVGAGAGYAPDYEGSADYAAVPLWSVRIGNLYGPATYVDLFATKLTSNLLPHPHLRLGPLVEYIPKRGHVENNAVDDLQNVDPAVMLGGLLGWDFVDEPAQAVGVELQVRGDVAKGHGYLVSPAFRLRRAFAGQLTLAGALVGICQRGLHVRLFRHRRRRSERLDRYDADAGFDAGRSALGLGQGSGCGEPDRPLPPPAGGRGRQPDRQGRGRQGSILRGAVVGYRF